MESSLKSKTIKLNKKYFFLKTQLKYDLYLGGTTNLNKHLNKEIHKKEYEQYLARKNQIDLESPGLVYNVYTGVHIFMYTAKICVHLEYFGSVHKNTRKYVHFRKYMYTVYINYMYTLCISCPKFKNKYNVYFAVKHVILMMMTLKTKLNVLVLRIP